MKRTFILAAVAGLLTAFVGCVTDVGEPDEEVAQAEDELSTMQQSFVTVRPDLRRCRAPLCGGYFVRDVNTFGRELYVSELVFPRDLFTPDTVEKTLAAPYDVVLRGQLGPADRRFFTRTFVVSAAYRGMPGFPPHTGDHFYSVEHRDPPIACLVAPCNNEIATLLNTREKEDFTRFSPDGAAANWVDEEWLASRVEDHGALVAGRFVAGEHFPGGYESVLEAHQIYVRLPDRVGPCPRMPEPVCHEGEMATYERTADRCVVFDACVEPGFCTMMMPVCAPGYELTSWPAAPGGCPEYACDPSFLAR